MTKENALTVINTTLQSARSQFEVALPNRADVGRFIRVALTEIRKNPDLLKCDPNSLAGSVLQAAQVGLEVGGIFGHAYLVPYKSECQLQVGYRGFIELARRSGQIVSISARVVREGDHFDYEYGLQEKLIHRPGISSQSKLTHVYAVARMKDGGHQFEVMTYDQVEHVRKSSPGGNRGPWRDHFEEMAKKTVIRRLFKYLPVSAEAQAAVTLDELADAGVSQKNDKVLEGEVIPAQSKSAIDAINDEAVGGEAVSEGEDQEERVV
jgi:recombination protein RecT